MRRASHSLPASPSLIAGEQALIHGNAQVTAHTGALSGREVAGNVRLAQGSSPWGCLPNSRCQGVAREPAVSHCPRRETRAGLVLLGRFLAPLVVHVRHVPSALAGTRSACTAGEPLRGGRCT